jgi:acyl-coenzyme A thioesterase PaaI-like protein
MKSSLEKLILPFAIGSGRTFVDDESKLRMELFLDRKSQEVTGTVWMSPSCEGPPGFVHGGVSCYVLDEAMGAAAFAFGYPAKAAKLSFAFWNMVPQKTELSVRAWIDGPPMKEINAVVLRAELKQGDEVLVKGFGDFRVVSEKELRKSAEDSGQSTEVIDAYYASLAKP